MYRQRSQQALPQRSGFTIIELLVVVAIIGVLIALILPAVQQTREAARSTQCKNNLKQISLATLNFHDTYRAFPPARIMPRPGDPPQLSCGRGSVTWFVRILPFLDQGNLRGLWDPTIPFASHDADTRNKALPIFMCPTRRSVDGAKCPTTTTPVSASCGCSGLQTFIGGATGDYAGNHGDISPGAFGFTTDFYWGGYGTGVLIGSRAFCVAGQPRDWIDKVKLKDVTDGSTNTILVGEAHLNPGGLNRTPEDGCIYDGWHFSFSTRIGGPGVKLAPSPDYVDTRLYSFGSIHSGRCHFALSDGSVRAISTDINEDLFGQLCNRKDGDHVDGF